MNEELELFFVDNTVSFDDSVEHLVRKKKFRRLPKQIRELKAEFENGVFRGTPIMHLDTPIKYEVYKLRMKNDDTNQGAKDGYRLIYGVMKEDKLVVLVTIYYKKDQENITQEEILWMLKGYLMRYLPEESDEDLTIE
jgi:mRNA-degrading endonuclease RelE of RelBE toxin-antitoxin system